MVEATIKAVNRTVPVRTIVATRGKAVRAEPIAAFYEQGRVKHVGNLHLLEDQLCEWDPTANGPSPDRLDSMVWGLTDLMTTRQPMVILKEALEASARPRGYYAGEPGYHGVKIFYPLPRGLRAPPRHSRHTRFHRRNHATINVSETFAEYSGLRTRGPPCSFTIAKLPTSIDGNPWWYSCQLR